nr:translation initiation factor IF-2-like [Gorilla gorilla gorilla]
MVLEGEAAAFCQGQPWAEEWEVHPGPGELVLGTGGKEDASENRSGEGPAEALRGEQQARTRSQERPELGDGLQWLRSPGAAGRLLAAVSARSRPRSLETFGEACGGWEEKLSSLGTNPPAAPAPLLRLPVRPSCSLPPSPAPAPAGRLPPRVAEPGPRAPQPRPPGLSACAQVVGASRPGARGLTAGRTQVPAAWPSSPNLARSGPRLARSLPGSRAAPGRGQGRDAGGASGGRSRRARGGGPRAAQAYPGSFGQMGRLRPRRGLRPPPSFPSEVAPEPRPGPASFHPALLCARQVLTWRGRTGDQVGVTVTDTWTVLVVFGVGGPRKTSTQETPKTAGAKCGRWTSPRHRASHQFCSGHQPSVLRHHSGTCR